jgi:hypothetical protein
MRGSTSHMRKIILFVLCSVMVAGGLYAVVFDLVYASVAFTRVLIGATCLAVVGGYLIWTDFVAPLLGIKTWEDASQED